MSNAVGNHDDAVGVDLLGPRGGHLTMKQTGVDTDVGNLDVPVADDRSRRDGACRSSGGRSRLLLLGLRDSGLTRTPALASVTRCFAIACAVFFASKRCEYASMSIGRLTPVTIAQNRGPR